MSERGSEQSSERGWIEPIVERVVEEVLRSHAVQLRTEITRRVASEIASQPANAFSSTSADLARTISEIQLGSSQKEILRALLDSSARYAARVVLFVVKGSHASGWQARGFATNDALKDFALDSNAAAVVRALNDRAGTNAGAGEFDGRFIEQFGTANHTRLLPLILKDKVAALIYADGGVEDKALDAGALDVLVLATGSWLEVNFAAQTGPEDAVRGACPRSTNRPLRQARRRTLSPIHLPRTPRSMQWPPLRQARQPLRLPSSLHACIKQKAKALLSKIQSAAVAEPEVAAEPLAVGHVQTRSRPPLRRLALRCRRRTKRFTARLGVSRACWSMRSSSTTRPSSRKAARTRDLYDAYRIRLTRAARRTKSVTGARLQLPAITLKMK